MEQYKIKCISSLAKVFPLIEPEDDLKEIQLSAFQNEVLSFQVAYKGNMDWTKFVTLDISSPLNKCMNIRQVKVMPSLYPCGPNYDGDFLDTKPGLYPDLLRKIKNKQVQVLPGLWHSVWVDIEPGLRISGGDYQIEISLKDSSGNILCCTGIIIRVYKGMLPDQTLKNTQWFHADCLADYYHVIPWSKKHWKLIDNFLSIYTKRGMNTILTPTFTPPLDTAVGGERTTVQLVEVTAEGNNYYFNFDKLKQWINLCEKHGIVYFEMAHLFTQWGAKHAPKIMGWKHGSYRQLFGWNTDAGSEEYAIFLKAYLAALLPQLYQWNLQGRVYFHLSDEPEEGDMEAYAYARELVKDCIGDYPIIDALSHYPFYENGLADNPIPVIDRIEPFLENKVPDLWTYYCCAQEKEVSNRFFAMPSARNRILGIQLYKYDIKGFLHWGFNFYNTKYSLEHINPYEITDAGGFFQSGDSFLVYPGADEKPEESIRLMVFAEAIQDVRALEWLESLTSKEFVLKLIEEGLDEPLTFKRYPADNAYILKLRSKVNNLISALLTNDITKSGAADSKGSER